MATTRVWDRYLSERDKLHLQATQREGRRLGFGRRPALLLIDLYRGVFGDRPQPLLEAIKEWPSSCGLDAWEALPHIQSLLSTARETGMPVIHVTGLPEHESGIGRQPARYEGAGQTTEFGGRYGRTDHIADYDNKMRRRYDIIDEVAPIAGEVVLRKAANSAFFGTPLVAHLSGLGVDTIIVGGESTSGCVRASVVDAKNYRFATFVVEECVFDRHQAAHAMNLFDINQKYARVLPLAEAQKWMLAWEPPEDFPVRSRAGALADHSSVSGNVAAGAPQSV